MMAQLGNCSDNPRIRWCRWPIVVVLKILIVIFVRGWLLFCYFVVDKVWLLCIYCLLWIGRAALDLVLIPVWIGRAPLQIEFARHVKESPGHSHICSRIKMFSWRGEMFVLCRVETPTRHSQDDPDIWSNWTLNTPVTTERNVSWQTPDQAPYPHLPLDPPVPCILPLFSINLANIQISSGFSFPFQRYFSSFAR